MFSSIVLRFSSPSRAQLLTTCLSASSFQKSITVLSFFFSFLFFTVCLCFCHFTNPFTVILTGFKGGAECGVRKVLNRKGPIDNIYKYISCDFTSLNLFKKGYQLKKQPQFSLNMRTLASQSHSKTSCRQTLLTYNQ